MTPNQKKRDEPNPWTRLEHALVKKCADRSCKLRIKKAEARILKCDMLNPSMGLDRKSPMSDFLVFSKPSGSFMGAVELKSGSFKVEKVRIQLENGAKLALHLAKKLPDFRSSTVFLILAANRFGNDLDQMRLQDPVLINGTKHKIRPCACGSKLADMVKPRP